MQDGRSSEAMVALAQRLRDYKVAVRLMQRGWDEAPAGDYRLDNERSMADSIKEAARAYPDAVILIYSGDLHAQKTISPFDKNLPLAASLLPRGELISIDVVGQNGTAWNCFSSGCGIHPYIEEGSHARGIVMGAPREGFDATAYTGLPTTASLPAITPGK
ncbi:MAG TPA: hypothetical protein VKP60_05290, partial [Magnetospirillaceae bacterium]|nr:hypothetical protein [Magnetospirillaceae bacterium]